jgi:hypothetical protein
MDVSSKSDPVEAEVYTHRLSVRAIAKIMSWSLGLALLVAAAIAKLEVIPPLFWDEGWTLSVARNWVELGHYGRLSLGEKTPQGLQAAYPVMMSVSLAFKFLGIGVWQARLVFVVYFIAAVAILFALACRFYDRRVAVASLMVLFLSGGLENHPLLFARQVFGEIPAIFFLLAGYLCFLRAERGIYLIGAIVFWSLALVTKVQVLPFWFASLILPLAAAVFLRRWAIVRAFAIGFLSAWVLAYLVQELIVRFLIPAGLPVSGLPLTIGVVANPFRRLIALITTLEIAVPTLMGLVWVARQVVSKDSLKDHTAAVRLAYFVLTGSWFAWYLLFSVGWPRYLLPAMFLSSIFAAVMIRDWTDGFQVIESLRRAATDLARFRLPRSTLYVISGVVLTAWAVTQTVSDLKYAIAAGRNDWLGQTVQYVQKELLPTAVIESYDAELFFFLRHRYHYPPDQVHVELIRQKEHAETPAIDYDPLKADPDYLIVGPWCSYYRCYDAVLSGDNFRLVKRFGSYRIFERMRNTPGS